MGSAKTQTERKGREWTLLTVKALRDDRAKLGLSRKQLADLLGVSAGAIQNWESETGTPDETMQGKILTVLAEAAKNPRPEGKTTVKKTTVKKPARAAKAAKRAASKCSCGRSQAIATMVAAILVREPGGTPITDEVITATIERAGKLLPV